MKLVYHPEANTELREAAHYYEDRMEGLGDRFMDEVDRTLNTIASFPEIGREDWAGFRVFRVKHFPFNLLYKAFPDHIYILAVAHQRRRQGYWQNRKV